MTFSSPMCLSSNDWFNNFTDSGKPKSHYNRFGGAFGGPVRPSFLGRQDLLLHELRRGTISALWALRENRSFRSFREGIIQERDANGNIVQYNLATSTACGASRGTALRSARPRPQPDRECIVEQVHAAVQHARGRRRHAEHLRLSIEFVIPARQQLRRWFAWITISEPSGVFSAATGTSSESNPTTNQVDIGGLLPGDTLGTPAAASNFPLGPRLLRDRNNGYSYSEPDQRRPLQLHAEPVAVSARRRRAAASGTERSAWKSAANPRRR